MEETIKAYLAGLLDADGHISICCATANRSKPQYWLQVGITQSNKEFLELIQRKIGAGTIYRNNKAGTSGFHNRQRYQLQLHGKAAAKLLEQLCDFLILKRQQAEIGIEFNKTITGQVDKLTQETRKSLREKMVCLNASSS